MTIHDAAAELDVSPATVRQYLRAAQLQGRKVKGRWWVNGFSVRRLRKRRMAQGK